MLRPRLAVTVAFAALCLIGATKRPEPLLAEAPAQTPDLPGSMILEPAQPVFGSGQNDDVALPDLVQQVADLGSLSLDENMRCLASAVYNEARGEPFIGQLAVAQVVLNRAADPRWPATICGVVYQRYQFSFTFDGRPDFPDPEKDSWKQSKAVAVVAVTDAWHDVTGAAVYYHADYVRPSWHRAFNRTASIGRHIFYR